MGEVGAKMGLEYQEKKSGYPFTEHKGCSESIWGRH